MDWAGRLIKEQLQSCEGVKVSPPESAAAEAVSLKKQQELCKMSV